MYTHPVIPALAALDKSADNYQENRVKLINKYTHTIDPVIDVDSGSEDDEENEEAMLEQFDSAMAGMLQELSKENKSRPAVRPKVSEDLPTLLKLLAHVHGVLKGAPDSDVVLSEEERLLVAAVGRGDAAEVARLLTVPDRASLELDDGDSILHYACRHPTDRVIAAIARMRPDLNWTNFKGRTPLHELASCGGSLAVLGSLVKLGADPWMRDNMGFAPVDLIKVDAVREGFEKWLTSHNYLPPNVEPQVKLFQIPVFTKSGRRVVTECPEDTTVANLLNDLPVELAMLRPFAQHLTVVEYRRKNGDIPPKLSLLTPQQKVVELSQSWGEDPMGANSLHRFLLVPAKTAPRECVDAYQSGGFGTIGYKK